MTTLEPILTILARQTRRGVVALILFFGVTWGLVLVVDYAAGQRRLRDLIAAQSISSAEAAVYNQEALLVQRDLDRSLSAVKAVVQEEVAVSVELDGHPIAHAGDLPPSARLAGTFETTSTLKNGQTLKVVIASSYAQLLQRLGLILLMGIGMMIIMSYLTNAAVRRVLQRLVSPLADGIATLEALSRDLEDPRRVLGASWPVDLCQEANALREAIGRLATSLDAYQKVERRNVTNEAIARTTQMLAHDVRKPFSIVNLAMTTLAKPDLEPAAFRRFVASARASLEDAMKQVNGLIADVMEIGSTTKPVATGVSARALLAKALVQAFPGDRLADAKVDDLSPRDVEVKVDELKFLRVLVNILDNARQAVAGKGRIWYAAEQADHGVTLIIGNDGPLIAAEDQERIFDAFFTKDKKGGTGLGLAIAKKVVAAHGGTIVCRSTPERGTEFRIDLPRNAD